MKNQIPFHPAAPFHLVSKNRFWSLFLLCVLSSWSLPARAQYLGVSGGGLFSRDLQSSPEAGQTGGPARSNFSNSGILAVEAGVGFFPLLSAGLHYSFTGPELQLRRGDAFGSSARMDLSAHTLAFETRLRTPEVSGFRLYGLLGAGFSRFSLDVTSTVEDPFPRGAPDSILSPVFTFGGGIEKGIAPFVRLKLEARDYVTPISKQLFDAGGAWHRPAILAGIVLGR